TRPVSTLPPPRALHDAHPTVFARRGATERDREQPSHHQDRKHDDDDYGQRLLHGWLPSPGRPTLAEPLPVIVVVVLSVLVVAGRSEDTRLDSSHQIISYAVFC